MRSSIPAFFHVGDGGLHALPAQMAQHAKGLGWLDARYCELHRACCRVGGDRMGPRDRADVHIEPPSSGFTVPRRYEARLRRPTVPVAGGLGEGGGD